MSYNVQEYLQHCIDTILAQKNIDVEIIVVDNNSTDGTKEFIKSKYPHVKLIVNSDNVGFSAANNRGIKEASGEIIFLLNPDTELPDTSTLQYAIKYLETNPQTAILAPRILNTDFSFQPSFWNFPSIKKWMLELFYLHRLKKTKEPSSPLTVEAASGAALFFRKSLIGEIGGLDENMFWMEDVDFCFRASKTKRKIVWTPEIKIIHHGGKSSVGNEAVTIPNQVMSKIKFSKKHDTGQIFYLINILSLLFILSRLCVFTLASIIIGKYKIKRNAYWITLGAYFSFNFKGNAAIIK